MAKYNKVIYCRSISYLCAIQHFQKVSIKKSVNPPAADAVERRCDQDIAAAATAANAAVLQAVNPIQANWTSEPLQ